MKFNKRIMATADGHIERIETRYIDKYIKYTQSSIEEYRPNIFIYAGDAADSRNVRAESEEYQNLTRYIVSLYKACIENDVIPIYIKGTPSHDGDVIKRIIEINELNEFMYVEQPTVYFHRGFSILLLPEIYTPTLETFYKIVGETIHDAGLDKVDAVAFHGMMDFAIPQLKQVDSHFNQSRSVVIDTDNFMNTFVRGIAFGGHVHKSICYKNCYYLGRFVNEKHQSPTSDLFGYKFIEIDSSDNISITNITNPYLLNYKFLDIRITKETTIDDILSRITKHNIKNENTVFKVFIDKNKESRHTFNLWKKVYKPLNVKRKFIAEDIGDLSPESISKVDSIIVDTGDIQTMVERYYKELTDETLDRVSIDYLFGDDDNETT
ncbi:MAG: hypothetical protein ACRCX8_12750 [Sarcina sp.]